MQQNDWTNNFHYYCKKLSELLNTMSAVPAGHLFLDITDTYASLTRIQTLLHQAVHVYLQSRFFVRCVMLGDMEHTEKSVTLDSLVTSLQQQASVMLCSSRHDDLWDGGIGDSTGFLENLSYDRGSELRMSGYTELEQSRDYDTRISKCNDVDNGHKPSFRTKAQLKCVNSCNVPATVHVIPSGQEERLQDSSQDSLSGNQRTITNKIQQENGGNSIVESVKKPDENRRCITEEASVNENRNLSDDANSRTDVSYVDKITEAVDISCQATTSDISADECESEGEIVIARPKSRGKTGQLSMSHQCLLYYSLQCFECNNQHAFKSEQLLTQHWRDVHIHNQMDGRRDHIACSLCAIRFELPSKRFQTDVRVKAETARYLNHKVKSHGVSVPSYIRCYLCPTAQCFFLSFTQATFEKHRQSKVHQLNRGVCGLLYKSFKCFLCSSSDFSFSSKPELREHVLRFHVHKDPDGVSVLHCPKCAVKRSLLVSGRKTVGQSVFYSLYRILHHLVSRHRYPVPDFVQSFVCPYSCGYTAVARADIESHALRHVKNSVAWKTCDTCQKQVRRKTFKSHRRICCVALSHRRTLQCSGCPLKFVSRYSLRAHVLSVHERRKTFRCGHCRFVTNFKSNLEDHVFHKHRKNVSRRSPLMCNMCGFETLKKAALKRHVDVVHRDDRDFCCTVCGKPFKCQLHLNNHMVSHEERRFQCTQCDYKAARKANLTSHVQAQHSDKTYRCDRCGYATGYPANLSKHQRLVCSGDRTRKKKSRVDTKSKETTDIATGDANTAAHVSNVVNRDEARISASDRLTQDQRDLTGMLRDRNVTGIEQGALVCNMQTDPMGFSMYRVSQAETITPTEGFYLPEFFGGPDRVPAMGEMDFMSSRDFLDGLSDGHTVTRDVYSKQDAQPSGGDNLPDSEMVSGTRYIRKPIEHSLAESQLCRTHPVQSSHLQKSMEQQPLPSQSYLVQQGSFYTESIVSSDRTFDLHNARQNLYDYRPYDAYCSGIEEHTHSSQPNQSMYVPETLEDQDPRTSLNDSSINQSFCY